ncbi:MAG: glycosyltransferase [Hydrocarboniphaga sp.]|uniref:glycosyltransferase family 4 protein n=1 Tax=Hydrocarboniphaga sp. TaxID=2033016 RepID=UPI00280C5E0E|nr:glycosyltransferase [Hydrocarboniphaga sp.]
MKIALVVPGGVDRSGEYRVIPVLLALIRRLACVHEVHVYALYQEASAGCWDLAGAKIHNVGDSWTRWRAVGAIVAEHRRARFDLVHSIFSGACGLIAVAAAMRLRLPSLVHIAGGELVALPEIGYGGRQGLKGRVREALVLRGASAITAASEPILASLRELGLQARRVPLGVDLQAWPPRSPRRRDSAAPARLIHVASLNRVKDQTTLLRALAALADAGVDFTMDIVGEDTLHGEIQALAAQLGLDRRIRFHGFQTQHSLRPMIEAADMHVMSSRHEAGPLSLLEAAVVGVPTVGTAVGHMAEWTPSACLTVAVGDWQGLASQIGLLLADEELRLRIGMAAQARALLENADETARRFQLIYADLIAPQ